MPPLPLRRPTVYVACLVTILTLAGCASASRKKPTTTDRAPAVHVSEDRSSLVHFLNRATFGARGADVEAVQREGVGAFLDRQMHPDRIDDAALDARLSAFETLNLSSRQIAEQYFLPAQEARRRRQMEAQAGKPSGSAPGLKPGSPTNVPTSAAPMAPAARATPPAPDRRPQVIPAADPQVRKERRVLQELSNQKVLRAVSSERQLQEVLVDFWFNHFNVFAGKGVDRVLLTAYERDTIRPRVFGKFRDLLGATAESPAMLFFLDNWLSVDPNGPHLQAGGGRREAGYAPQTAGRSRKPGAAVPRRPAAAFRPPAASLPPGQVAGKRPARGLNENYARELMELHTLGADGGYTQDDVVQVARCFTGWTIAQPRDGGEFRFDVRWHDPGSKLVLGHVIKSGGGKADGDRVLDILARDPHTARFIAAKLVRRFVSDDPPPALVDRVARRFRQTDGDLREVYRAIFLSPEFWSEQARAAKLKTPFEFVVSSLRATGARVEDPTAAVQWVRTLGMPLYFCQPPSGYPDRADSWANTGSLLGRMNFALALADNRLPGIRLDLAGIAGSTPAASQTGSARADLTRSRTQLLHALFEDGASPATVAVMNKAVNVVQLVALALGAPVFQRK